MSATLPISNASALRARFGELDTQFAEIVEFLGGMFGELDELQEWAEEQARKAPPARDEAAMESLRGRLAAALEGRDRLQLELDAANAELARLSINAARLAEARQELSQARDEAAQLRLVVQQERARADQLAASQRDADSLASELELVRSRGAELTEALADQRRQTAVERAEWATELKQLRQLLERQSEVLARRYEALASEEPGSAKLASPQQVPAAVLAAVSSAVVPPPASAVLVPVAMDIAAPATNQVAMPGAASLQPPASPASPAAANGGASDGVLDTVMAQFSRLQQDAHRRRQGRGGKNS